MVCYPYFAATLLDLQLRFHMVLIIGLKELKKRNMFFPNNTYKKTQIFAICLGNKKRIPAKHEGFCAWKIMEKNLTNAAGNEVFAVVFVFFPVSIFEMLEPYCQIVCFCFSILFKITTW